jgi:thiamine-monophosphate kinase
LPRPPTVASEEALIQGFLAPLAAGFPGAFGLKDDCACLLPPPGEDLVLTTDAVAEGVHFFSGDHAADVAWKALAVNVSDLAAKGARPIAYLMSLSFPEAPSEAWLQQFVSGLADAQTSFGIHLAGGDTDRRPGPVSISITAVGGVPAGRMVRRGTANPGDLLFLTGTLGDARLGLALRRDPELAEGFGLDAAGAASVVRRYLRPRPRLGLREALLGSARAAMDISDGLAKDLERLAKASGLRARVKGRDLPFSSPMFQSLESRPEFFLTAVTGGDDYEILAAVPPGSKRGFVAAATAGEVPVTEIGLLLPGEGVEILDRDGQILRIEAPGWDHFGGSE